MKEILFSDRRYSGKFLAFSSVETAIKWGKRRRFNARFDKKEGCELVLWRKMYVDKPENNELYEMTFTFGEFHS